MPMKTLDLDQVLGSTSHTDFPARRQLADVNIAIAKAKKVVVVSGAGISCSSGIPDFRSEDGLYALVKARYPDAFFSGRDLFSSGLFNNPKTTSIFHTFIAELTLACNKATPTKTHHLIHKLDKTGKLLRSYTQNVDGFERRLGIESGGRGNGLHKKKTRNIELHGDLGRVRCTLCFKDYAAREEWTMLFREGEAPDCPECFTRCEARIKRSARATAIGALRPSIVLYDEPHPLGDDIGQCQSHDLNQKPEILLIMGTSLKVHGLKRLVKEFAKAVHNPPKGKPGLVVFVNATPPAKEWDGIIDYYIQGETDKWAERVEEEWRRVRPSDWEVQTHLDGEMGLAQAVSEVVGVKSKDTAKGKGKATDKENDPPFFTAGQLPTPRPSQSPALSTPAKSTRSACPSSPLTPLSASSSPASPIPLSPSKRQNQVPSPADSLQSPSKKIKHTPPPKTGIPASPGRGNLFGNFKATENSQVADEEVFGSPVKRASRKTAKKSAIGGKENAQPPRYRNNMFVDL